MKPTCVSVSRWHFICKVIDAGRKHSTGVVWLKLSVVSVRHQPRPCMCGPAAAKLHVIYIQCSTIQPKSHEPRYQMNRSSHVGSQWYFKRYVLSREVIVNIDISLVQILKKYLFVITPRIWHIDWEIFLSVVRSLCKQNRKYPPLITWEITCH